MSSTAPQQPFRRRVFYIPGYDPFPPRRYRELYRRESAKQADISDYQIAMHPREAGEGFGWQVSGQFGSAHTLTDIDVLVWSDIVRNSRPASIVRTYADLLRTVWVYLSTGALFRLVRLRKGPVIAAFYPVLMLLVQAQIAFAVGWLLWRGAETFFPGPLAIAAIPVAVGAGLAVLWAFRRNDGKLFAYYLMHDYAFSSENYGAYGPLLEARLAEFADRISTALDSPVDEVLVVGHSSGAHLAVSVLADVMRRRALPHTPVLGLLTLGQVVPMLTFLPRAGRLRGDLARVSASESVFWVDVSAPSDGGCFALCDPLVVSGQEGAPDQPLVLSAAFNDTLSPEARRALKWRFFRTHFQYLCAFDRPRGYDYFRITAGPMTLAARYGGRHASPSRITGPVTRYTDAQP